MWLQLTKKYCLCVYMINGATMDEWTTAYGLFGVMCSGARTIGAFIITLDQ